MLCSKVVFILTIVRQRIPCHIGTKARGFSDSSAAWQAMNLDFLWQFQQVSAPILCQLPITLMNLHYVGIQLINFSCLRVK